MYSSPNIVRVIILRRMRWAGYVADMERRGEAYTGFWWGNMREIDHLGGPGVDGRMILRWGMDWIKLAQDRDRWWTLVNAVMNLRVP